MTSQSQKLFHIAAVLRKSIFRVLLFLNKESMLSIGTIRLFVGYTENAKYPPGNNCVSRSSHKIGKLAYLGLKITSLDQKHKIVRKAFYLGVRKLRKS